MNGQKEARERKYCKKEVPWKTLLSGHGCILSCHGNYFQNLGNMETLFPAKLPPSTLSGECP